MEPAPNVQSMTVLVAMVTWLFALVVKLTTLSTT